MNKSFTLRAGLFVATLLLFPLAQGTTMSKGDYRAGKSRISTDYKVDIVKCDALAGDPKAACVASAKARFGKT